MESQMETTMQRVLSALSTLRAPLLQGEYDLHHLVMEALQQAGIACEHEVSLAPRCRIDLMCGSVGVEIKRGQPERARIRRQLARYAQCAQVESLILVSEKTVDLPRTINGKPVAMVCLNRLWGIAL